MWGVAGSPRALPQVPEPRILRLVRVAAFSDLHIGAHRHTDGFEHALPRFEAWLTTLERTHDRIVLLGDIFQTDHGWRRGPEAFRRELSAAQRRLARLWDRFRGGGYVYVHGNHDEIAAEAIGAAEQFVAGGRYPALFIHGHQFYPGAGSAPAAANFGTWTCGRLRAAGLRPLARWLEGRDVAIKHDRFGGPAGPYAAGARTLARRHRTPIVVMGHTHVEAIDPIDEGLYVNTGTCSWGALSFASVDTDAGRVEVLGPGGRLEAAVTAVAPRPGLQ